MGTRWFVGRLDRQLSILVLGSYDRAGKDQLEERRRWEGGEYPLTGRLNLRSNRVGQVLLCD